MEAQATASKNTSHLCLSIFIILNPKDSLFWKHGHHFLAFLHRSEEGLVSLPVF